MQIDMPAHLPVETPVHKPPASDQWAKVSFLSMPALCEQAVQILSRIQRERITASIASTWDSLTG